MSKEFTMQELVDLIEAKAINGKVSLDDIGEIVFDTKFPEHLTKNAIEKLIEYSSDYRRYKELSGILLNKSQKALELLKKITVLNEKEYIDEDEEDKVVNEIYVLRLKQQAIEDEIKPLEEEFQKLQTYFKHIQ